MQPRVLPIRAQLTDAQVRALIKTDTSITIGMGMELLDRSLNVLRDVTADLRECSTGRDNTATLHGNCAFTTTTKMSWGRALVRPYMNIGNGVVSARFNQGAYFTSTPQTITDYVPATYSVTGVDILNALNTLVGDSYSIAVGDSYLTAVESILTNLGFSQYVIDPAQSAVTAPIARGWPLDDTTTWLGIVNELLKAVGYAPAYSDWDGRIICSSFNFPATRAPEWTYTRGQYDGQLVPGQTITHDYFSTPNRWVGVSDTGGVTPAEGNGVFTYVNQSGDETSIDARQQVITRVIQGLAVADQPSLVAAVMAEVAKDKNVGTTMSATSSANPLHWHNDIVKVETLELGNITMQQSRWSMDLRTGSMSHDWAAL